MNSTQDIYILTPLGKVLLNQTLVVTWLLSFLLISLAVVYTRKLNLRPGLVQSAIEGIVETILEAIRAVVPEKADMIFPFLATLWIFLVAANLAGIVPGLKSPTADLSTTSALATMVFLSVHWFGIRSEGVRSYLKHYLSPTPLMLPFHIVSEITRTIALAVRLFGNMMSLQMAALMLLCVAGLLVPVPILMLHIVEALVQAYIFGMLALIYIASGIESQRHRKEVKSNGS